MFLNSLASAFPGRAYSQSEVWELIQSGPAIDLVSRRGAKILETVLRGDSGIQTRHFAIEPPRLFSLDAQQLNEAFEQEAPALAAAALAKALGQAGVDASQLDALFLCTCTGYLCPGVTSHVAERLGLREDAVLHDVTGLGCGAAIPTLHAARCFLAAHPQAVVGMVAVEVSSAAFFLCDDPGVVVSACLFGDGASASIWTGGDAGGRWQASKFRSVHIPSEREKIRFVNDGGRLRNKLDRAVPGVAAAAVQGLFSFVEGRPDAVIAHPGGRDVIDALEAVLPGYQLADTRAAMSDYGNMSSPSVMVALERRLADNAGDRRLWLTAFGAGFSAYCCELECTA